MIANYHTHTTRCRHAKGNDREYVEAAIERGLKILGFADHTPFPLPGYGTGMYPEDLEDYTNAILALKNEYKNEIDIYLGLEVENAPDQFEALQSLLKNYPLEYLILGQHAVFGFDDYKVAFKPTDRVEVFEAYCNQCVQAMESGLFTYWAHPDVIYFEGNTLLYEKRMRELCIIAKQWGLPLEINMNGISYQRNYPNPVFWKIAGEENCPVIIGIDAHKPEHIRNLDAAYASAMNLVQTYHLKLQETVTLKKPF